jgi:hypothetical protein
MADRETAVFAIYQNYAMVSNYQETFQISYFLELAFAMSAPRLLRAESILK